MRLCFHRSIAGLLSLLFVPLLAAESVEWVFEGHVWEIDPALQAHIGEDWVFSGSLELSLFPPYLEEETFEGGIEEAEFTFDDHRLVTLSAIQRDGWPLTDLMPGSEGDVLVLSIPVEGTAADDGWQVTWMQLGLHGAPRSLLPAGIEWPDWGNPLDAEWGWFRLIFYHPEEAVEARVEGGLDAFVPVLTEFDPEAEIEHLNELLHEMGLRLGKRDDEIGSLQAELERARKQIDGLYRTIDRLGDDQAALRSERDRLLETRADGDDEWRQKLANLEADYALLDESHRELQHDFESLAEAYRESESERRRLRRERDHLSEQLDERRQSRSESLSGETRTETTPSAEPDGQRFRIVEHEPEFELIEPEPQRDEDATDRPDPESADAAEQPQSQASSVVERRQPFWTSGDVSPTIEPETRSTKSSRGPPQRRRGPRGRN